MDGVGKRTSGWKRRDEGPFSFEHCGVLVSALRPTFLSHPPRITTAIHCLSRDNKVNVSRRIPVFLIRIPLAFIHFYCPLILHDQKLRQWNFSAVATRLLTIAVIHSHEEQGEMRELEIISDVRYLYIFRNGNFNMYLLYNKSHCNCELLFKICAVFASNTIPLCRSIL